MSTALWWISISCNDSKEWTQKTFILTGCFRSMNLDFGYFLWATSYILLYLWVRVKKQAHKKMKKRAKKKYWKTKQFIHPFMLPRSPPSHVTCGASKYFFLDSKLNLFYGSKMFPLFSRRKNYSCYILFFDKFISLCNLFFLSAQHYYILLTYVEASLQGVLRKIYEF